MDYSTISNKTSLTDMEDVTNGELSEQYYLLKKQHANLTSSYDVLKQELHDVKRNYQTAMEVQSHISAEFERYQADEDKRKNEAASRVTALQEEISLLRQERTELIDKHSLELKKYQDDLRALRQETECMKRESPVRDCSELDEIRTAMASIQSDAESAKAALEQTRAEVDAWRQKAEELATEIGEVRELGEMRKEEVQAAAEREAVALADLAEARALLHQCTESQDMQPHAAKGNSLFAEVEDKRQEMAKNLIQMKQTNSRLRRELANKQAELDALLHEKQTVWEQQAGASAHYDRELIESYEDRITQLEGLCERQRREQARWFDKLCEKSPNRWLPGVMDHLK
ncbi:hypothetical protein ACJJTC_005461 [Scirpophaga incertulas]